MLALPLSLEWGQLAFNCLPDLQDFSKLTAAGQLATVAQPEQWLLSIQLAAKQTSTAHSVLRSNYACVS